MDGITLMTVGIFGLVFDWLTTKGLSATFIVLGIVGVVVTNYDQKKEKYSLAGPQLTQLFNKLKTLYFNAKNVQAAELPGFEEQLATIQEEYGKIGLCDQMLFSGWPINSSIVCFLQPPRQLLGDSIGAKVVDTRLERIKIWLFRHKIIINIHSAKVLYDSG